LSEQNFVECPTCKVETTPDLFEKKENWESTKETLTILGFDIENPETQKHFRELVKGYCAVCGEVRILREAIIQKLKEQIQDQQTEKTFLNALDNLIDLAKES